MKPRFPISNPKGASGFLSILLSAWTAACAQAAIVINEIHYHPPTESQAEEFIELHNSGDLSVDLEGWRIETGIDFVFGAGNLIPPGGYVVVARSLPEFHAMFPGFVGDATGGFSRNLGNTGDRIDLRDSSGALVDSVDYLDRAPWPVEADGEGPSLELMHPGLDNSLPQSWRSSLGPPTPGERNSVFRSNPPPTLSDARHSPLVPTPTDSIRVRIRCDDERPVSNVRVFHRITGMEPGGFTEQPMADDGAHHDDQAGDGVFGAVLPPQPEGSIVEFYIVARDASGQTTSFPPSAPTDNGLIRVDSTVHPSNAPLYRVVMTPADLETLRTRFVFDNELLNCTFIEGGEAYYGRGIRYRGSSTRVIGPRESFRIEFSPGREFDSRSELNLNGNGTLVQAVGWDLFAAFGIANPLRRVVHVVLNGEFHDLYFQIESLDTPFLRDQFNEDRRGNLYRGVETADFQYLGPDPEPYRAPYEKKNHRDEDDYSDVIELTRVFSLDSQKEFDREIVTRIDVRQWLRFFALHSVLSNQERGIQLADGDDYFIYRREVDDRFIMLPWDLDGVFGEIVEPLFRQSVPAIVRLIQNPLFVRYYFEGIEEILEGVYHPDELEATLQKYRGVFTDSDLDGILYIAELRRSFLQRQFPRQLTVEFPDDPIPSLEFCPRPSTFGEALRMRGTGSAAYTVGVRVGGVEASWDPMTGGWEHESPLEPGDNPIEIEELDAEGGVLDRIEFVVHRIADPTRLGGVLEESLTLREEDSPFHVTRHLIVPSTLTLTIEPGCRVFLDDGVGIRVDGVIEALGTGADPILFRPSGCFRWGGIALQSTGNRFEHCEFEGAGEAEIEGVPAPTTLTLNGGEARVEDCRLLECLRGFNVNGGGDLTLVRTNLLRCGLGLFAVNSDLHVEDCTFEETRNNQDGLQAIGRGRRVPIIQGCLFLNGPRDAVDLTATPALVFQNTIRDFPNGAGIRMRGDLGPRLVRNVIADCREGISIDAQTPFRIEHQTVTRNEIAVELASAVAVTPEIDGAIRDSILWENGEDFRLPEGARLTVEFSNLGSGLKEGVGNLSVNPLFADPSRNDFRLRANSPSLRKARNEQDMGAFQQSVGRRSHLLLR